MLFITWTDSNGITDAIDVDCMVTLKWKAPAEVTEHRVEQGAAISDNSRAGNDSLTLDCRVTNSPIFDASFGTDSATRSLQTVDIGGGAKVSAYQWSAALNRSQRTHAQIIALRDAGTLLTITTNSFSADSCLIELYEVTQTARTGKILSFTLDVKRIRVATTQTVATQPVQRRGQNQQNRGNQPAQETETSPLDVTFFNGQ